MKIKELREKYKLTQAALAESLGVSSITISAVETGRTKVSSHLSAKIQEVYGETVEPETKRVKAAEKAVAKKARTARKKTEAAAKTAAAEVSKIEKKARRAKKAKVVIQSPMGGEITTEDILKKIGEAETVYVRVDQNKAYWVKGDETGSVELW